MVPIPYGRRNHQRPFEKERRPSHKAASNSAGTDRQDGTAPRRGTSLSTRQGKRPEAEPRDGIPDAQAIEAGWPGGRAGPHAPERRAALLRDTTQTGTCACHLSEMRKGGRIFWRAPAATAPPD